MKPTLEDLKQLVDDLEFMHNAHAEIIDGDAGISIAFHATVRAAKIAYDHLREPLPADLGAL